MEPISMLMSYAECFVEDNLQELCDEMVSYYGGKPHGIKTKELFHRLEEFLSSSNAIAVGRNLIETAAVKKVAK